MIHKVIGSHIGLYERWWKLMKYNNKHVHQALDILRKWAQMHLASCINESPNVIETVMVL